MSIEIQCMTEKLIVITIKLDYSKVLSKSTVPTYASKLCKDSNQTVFRKTTRLKNAKIALCL